MSWRTSLGEVIECLTCYCEWQGTGHPPLNRPTYIISFFDSCQTIIKKKKSGRGPLELHRFSYSPFPIECIIPRYERKKERKKLGIKKK
jgi:hypothetical protein